MVLKIENAWETGTGEPGFIPIALWILIFDKPLDRPPHGGVFSAGDGGRGGLTMSREGGWDEFDEFFLSRAFSASSSITRFSKATARFSNSAIRANSGPFAFAINSLTWI